MRVAYYGIDHRQRRPSNIVTGRTMNQLTARGLALPLPAQSGCDLVSPF